MSIAGDTQPRVPGFNSYSETVLSPRRSGIAWSTATLPGNATLPTSSGDGLAIGSATSTGSPSIAIGSGIASNVAGISIGSTSVTGIGSIAIGYPSNPINTNASILLGAGTVSATGAITIGGGTASASNALSIASGTASANNAVAIRGTAAATDSIAIRGTVNTGATYGTAIGASASIAANVTEALSIGAFATINTNATQGIAIGSGATVNASRGIAIAFNSTCSGINSAAIGNLANTEFQGQINLCNARFAATNDIATSTVPMYMTTTTAAATNLATGAGIAATVPTGTLTCTNNSTYIFEVDIVAKAASNAGAAAYNLKFAFDRQGSAATSEISALSKTILYTRGTTTGWDVTATANTTTGVPDITVTGAAGTTIRWVGNVKMTKVAH